MSIGFSFFMGVAGGAAAAANRNYSAQYHFEPGLVMTPVLSAAVCVAIVGLLASCSQLPEAPPAAKVVWLEQNWSAAQRQWFHHVSQGTATLPLPYDWFMVIEQAELRPFGTPALFSDPAHLRRWGFIDSPLGSGNPGGLPVGFAIDEKHRDPNTGQVSRAIGLTCAACHTGQLRFQGTAIVVDGGPAMRPHRHGQRAGPGGGLYPLCARPLRPLRTAGAG